MRLKCCLLLATTTRAFLARRLGLLRRRTARSAAVATETTNATLLACAQAPDLFYLGDNETLYLRDLNSTRQLQNANEPKIIKEENKELITQPARPAHDRPRQGRLPQARRRRHTPPPTSRPRAAAIWDDNRGPTSFRRGLHQTRRPFGTTTPTRDDYWYC